MRLKVSYAKWRPFCPGGDELILWVLWFRIMYGVIFLCHYFMIWFGKWLGAITWTNVYNAPTTKLQWNSDQWFSLKCVQIIHVLPGTSAGIFIAWWRHQMETFSALLAICAGNSPVPGEFPSQRPVMRSLMFSLICVRINDWVNNREAGDLRRYRAHNDVIVMEDRTQQIKVIRILIRHTYQLTVYITSDQAAR